MYKYKNKDTNIRSMNDYMFTKSLGMFEYEGLPETIPQMELEKQLQEKGFSFIYEHNNELYAFTGSLTGEPDVYGNYTKININNLALKLNKTVNLDDGVLIRSDDYFKGLTDLYDKYNFLLNENEISMTMNTYNNRIQNLISADDDNTKESAENFIQKIIDGDLSVIGESPVFDGLKVHNAQSNNSTSIINLIEFQQYIKATLFNEIGIDLNFNMKRERLTSGEVQQNTEMLFPLVNNMYNARKEGIKKVNEKYNLSISLEYGSIWKARDSEFSYDEEETEETEETEEMEETEETEGTEETEETEEEEEEDEEK